MISDAELGRLRGFPEIDGGELVPPVAVERLAGQLGIPVVALGFYGERD